MKERDHKNGQDSSTIFQFYPSQQQEGNKLMRVMQLSDFSREPVVRFVLLLCYEDRFSYFSVTNGYFCPFIGKEDAVRRKILC